MEYNFDKEIDRLGTASLKWDKMEDLFGDKDILPMWVADMDFTVPQPVVDSLKQRVDQAIYGYTVIPDSYYDAVIEWMKNRHNWNIKKEWICHSPGVVPGLSMIIEAFTEPGGKVMIQPPVYYPFREIVVKQGRELIYNPLKFENGQYVMDYDDLSQKLKSNNDVKLLILCSPHNPVGRVWSKDELTKLGEVCIEHGVMVVSDEIHSDLILKNNSHVNFATISKEFADHSIICTAPSKTFNLAGLQTSNIIIPNEEIRDTFTKIVDAHFLGLPNAFGVVALESAYRYGDEWLDQCLDYIESNLEYLTSFIETHIPKIKVIQPEGTYLVWLDCRKLGLDSKGLENFMQKEARVAFDEGYIFGLEGEGFTRINLACPRSILKEGLNRIKSAVDHRFLNHLGYKMR